MEGIVINWFAVIAATLCAFVLGALWYGPFFGKAWMAAVGLTPDDAQKVNMGLLLGSTFVFEFVMAWCLAMFLGNGVDALTGTLYGFLTGFAWVGLALAINAMYEQRSLRYIFINSGYWVAVFSLMGLIIGAWQ